MKISGAIFDLDDTLTYSEHIWEGIPQMFLKRHGKVAEEDIDRKIINLNTAQIGEYFKEHYFQDSKRTAKSIVTEFGIMGAPYYLFKVPLMPGTKKLVKQLYKQGVTMTILTANERHLVRAALRRLGILKYFDSIRCGSDPENAKSNPKSFENALAALGTPKEETFVFEDSSTPSRPRLRPASSASPCRARSTPPRPSRGSTNSASTWSRTTRNSSTSWKARRPESVHRQTNTQKARLIRVGPFLLCFAIHRRNVSPPLSERPCRWSCATLCTCRSRRRAAC